MRIFYAAPRAAWVELNLQRSLEAMGHTLVPFTFPGWPDDADPLWRDDGKPRTNQALLDAWRQALATGPVDLFFGYLYSSVVYPDTVREIRRAGIPTVNFSCNNVHQFDLVEAIAPEFDLYWVPEAKAIPDFQRVGARWVRIQLAANPHVYKPSPEPRVYDVTFVGQRYADRADFLLHLHRNGISVRAWGAGWQRRKRLDASTARAALALLEDEGLAGVKRLLRRRQLLKSAPAPVSAPPTAPLDGAAEESIATFGGPRLLQHQLIRTFSKSRISLGFATAGESHLGPNRLTHLRLREFEAPMSGAMYLTEQQDELAEYFEIGTEMLCYHDRADLLEQVRFYLARPEAAERVRRAGYQRALREHTWQHRFRELFGHLGLRDQA